MGNSQAKESRVHATSASSRVQHHDSTGNLPSPRPEPGPDRNTRPSPSARRGSNRPDLSFLGLGGSGERDVASLETRRETKQEREARKLEKEKATRLAERQRSMKEEHVDGGYLVTQGVYVGVEDFNKGIVRQLMIERQLAPFWRGLNDFSESWAEHQLMAAARGLPIPPPDQVPPELAYHTSRKKSEDPRISDKNLHSLTVPINSRSQSFNSDTSSNISPAYPVFSLPSPNSPLGSPTATTPFRTRAKTLASLTTSSKSNNAQADMSPREFQLPKDPFVNGQPIEAYLYKDSIECPICFLYYPPYLNTTRCCDQPICSECFVQIKRPDPHPPEHEQPDPNAPTISDTEREAQSDGQLVSEVATCPFCKQPEFGITFVPPPFRRGLTYGAGQQAYQIRSAMSSQTSLSSTGMSPGPGRRRGTSLSVNAPGVITTDKIRPDWATKLAGARAHAARRSAAATALHTAAYLMGGNRQPDPRAFAPFGRRGLLRRPTLEGIEGGSLSNAAHMNALALLAERHAGRPQGNVGTSEPASNPFLPPPRESSSRRSRIDDLEDMMMMEAIRLSLASEEERRRKEEKDAKKEAKKKDKESKKAEKAEKAAKKSGVYSMNSNSSNGGNEGAGTGTPALTRVDSNNSSIGGDDASSTNKGKGVDRTGTPPIGIPSSSDHNAPKGSSGLPAISLSNNGQDIMPSTFPSMSSEPSKRSHLRHMSTASSSASSFVEGGTSQPFNGSSTPPGGGAGLEPMFNFRSLSAMIADEEKADRSSHIEDNGDAQEARSVEEIQEEGPARTSSSTDSERSSQHETDGHANGKAMEADMGIHDKHEHVNPSHGETTA